MSILHHPLSETLADFAHGTLDEGRRLVVAAHLELCPSCRRLSRAIDVDGGRHLERLPPSPLQEGALQRALAQLDQPEPAPLHSRQILENDLSVHLRALAGCKLGTWRWIGPGVRWRSVSVPAPASSRVFLLKAASGTQLPHHSHTGSELTVILKGAFTHQGGRFGVGDCDDAYGSTEHKPVVERGEECICLVAMEGQIRLLGPLGRLLQPFIRL